MTLDLDKNINLEISTKEVILNALILASLTFSGISIAEERLISLNSFSTDNCTAFPEGLRRDRELWKECCVDHDIKYWMGGSRSDKKAADIELKRCVEAKGELLIGEIMMIGVGIGGTPFIKTPWRWGYGWNNRKKFQVIQENEKQMIIKELILAPNISDEIKYRAMNVWEARFHQ